MQISANDMAYAVSSLLESPNNLNAMSEDDKKNNVGVNNAIPNKNNQLKKIQDQEEREQLLENLNDCLHDYFWVAYDCLDPNKSNTLLLKGIQLAKEMQ
jgi:hypothetical protein